MAQCLRVYKPGIFIFTRSYSSQRQQRNYYDVLNVPPNATQKEIRQAFITMSKKTHPDVSGQNGHANFVKINEAYNTLSKEDLRYQYDMSLRHSKTHSSNDYTYYNYERPTVMYRNMREWEEAMAGAPRMDRQQTGPQSNHGLKLVFVVFLLGLVFHAATIMHSISIRQKMLQQSNNLAEILRKRRQEGLNRTPEEEREFIERIQNQFGSYKQRQD